MHRLQREDDGVALLTVVLLTLVLAFLSVLVLGSVLSQVRPTTFTQDNSRTVFAAEAGLQSALGQLRTAVTTTGAATYGDKAKLPCTVKGAVGATGENLSYQVQVRYYSSDPAGKDATWLDANDLPCTASGTSVTPAFAMLSSTGAADAVVAGGDAPGERTLETKYTFQLTNQNVAGGLMFTVTGQYCLEASGTTANSTVKYVPASSCENGKSTQMWVYDTDYAIKLAATVGTATPLCITGPFVAPASSAVKLTACVKGQWNQLWSYEGGAKFRGQNTANTNYGDNCLWSGVTTASLANRPLEASSGGCSSSNNEWGSWSPEPRVGAGAASYTTKQIVNYLEFGRCFDVTGQVVTSAYMIVYPCKQDPSPGGTKVLWNHKWLYTEATGVAGAATQIKVVDNNNTTYCLQTPAAGIQPAYVVLRSCTTGAANQQYMRFGDTGDYTTSYLLKAADGRCLSLGPRASTSGVNWSTIVAASCTGGSEQKWNAPADASDASVTGTRELP